jgi:hypothetical protein
MVSIIHFRFIKDNASTQHGLLSFARQLSPYLEFGSQTQHCHIIQNNDNISFNKTYTINHRHIDGHIPTTSIIWLYTSGRLFTS